MTWTGTGEAYQGEVSITTNGQAWSAETTAQIKAASLAVQDILKSGALGEPLGRYKVTMVGHGNPDHTPPSEEYMTDMLNILIAQIGDEQ